MSKIEFITELLGGIRIMISPLLVGLLIGAIIYLNKQDAMGLISAIAISLSGLIVGVIWATRVWKKQGTNQFLSRSMATPELDKETQDKSK